MFRRALLNGPLAFLTACTGDTRADRDGNGDIPGAVPGDGAGGRRVPACLHAACRPRDRGARPRS